VIKGTNDTWESELRLNIEGKFQDGKAINDYVGLRCFAQDNGTNPALTFRLAENSHSCVVRTVVFFSTADKETVLSQLLLMRLKNSWTSDHQKGGEKFVV
jgi:hypothetical protein